MLLQVTVSFETGAKRGCPHLDLSMQFLSSGLNMLQVSNFARELIWGGLLIFVMIVNTWRSRGART